MDVVVAVVVVQKIVDLRLKTGGFKPGEHVAGGLDIGLESLFGARGDPYTQPAAEGLSGRVVLHACHCGDVAQAGYVVKEAA